MDTHGDRADALWLAAASSDGSRGENEYAGQEQIGGNQYHCQR